MKFLESARIPEEKGNAIFQECVNSLASLGDIFKLTSDDFVFAGWYEATNLQGQTHMSGKDGKFDIQQVALNSHMLREGLEDILINTIYHELLHVVYNKYAIANNLLGWTDDGSETYTTPEWDEVQEHGGHWGKWLEWAKEVSEKLHLVLPITPYCAADEVERLIAANDDIEPAVEVYCLSCDNRVKFLSISPTALDNEFPELPILFELYYSTKEKIPNNLCGKCHGTLYIIIRDEKFRDLLDEKLDEFLTFMALRKLFA